ncbi:MAG: T9SS type A sorting domain-containing protein [Flavobacteriales bacterium]
MKTRYSLLAGTLLLHATSQACECSMVLPYTFCETLEPQWNEPHAVVLGVKLNEVYYGMRVKVIEVFHGDVSVGDTLTVWGDNGALCRHYVGTWNDGDTVVWGLHDTDFMGNEITAGFPPDLEQPGDHHISNCGTYWLGYAGGMVTGPIAPGVASTTVANFWAAMEECLFTAIPTAPSENGLRVIDGEGGPWLVLNAKQRAHLTITDAMGRSCLARDWDGLPVHLSVMAAGVYLVRVQAEEQRWVKKVAVP